MPGSSPRSATAATRPTSRSPTSPEERPGWRSATTAHRSRRSTAGLHACSCRTCISGRARSGCAAFNSWSGTSRASGNSSAIMTTATPGASSAIGVIPDVMAELQTTEAARIAWRVATVVQVHDETPRARTLVLDVPHWPRHRAGQHVDVRLVGEDGYQAQRSYSIASAPEDAHVALTVERLDDAEVSPYLCDVLQVGDGLELRGPIGGYFVWDFSQGGPLFLVAGGSGIVPLMAMLRHHAR